MNYPHRVWGFACLCTALIALPTSLFAQSSKPAASPVLDTIETELHRNFEALKKQETPAYFLSYEVIDTDNVSVSSSYGALMQSNAGHRRIAHLDLRVGDYALDNTHQLRGRAAMPIPAISPAVLPVEDDPAAIRAALWRETDRRYKQAATQLAGAKANAEVAVEQEDKSGDFSREKAEQAIEPIVQLHIDRKAWEDKIRRYTAPFHRYGDLFNSTATLTAERQTRWLVSSEGARIQTSSTVYRLFIEATSKAEDGMDLPRYESYVALTPQGLPDDATVLKAVSKMIADLQALRVAPVIDPQTVPAILSGRATAVFFHEVLGHRLEGHRQKNENEGQTFKKMVGQQILAPFLSVTFDPTAKRYGGVDLAGSYEFDDEGMKARPVVAVKDGVLESFLMSRSPIAGFPNSNGHGRAQPGLAPVARQSNLMILNSKPISRGALKKQLLALIQEQHKPYGLLFDDIQGGFTLTGRAVPNAFNVLPVMVYRVYPDGKEELVRGVDLVGTPLTVFSKIVAADDEIAVFNGFCGAESGQVPVSASGPAILISQVEVQKKAKSQERPPILPAPLASERGGTK